MVSPDPLPAPCRDTSATSLITLRRTSAKSPVACFGCNSPFSKPFSRLLNQTEASRQLQLSYGTATWPHPYAAVLTWAPRFVANVFLRIPTNLWILAILVTEVPATLPHNHAAFPKVCQGKVAFAFLAAFAFTSVSALGCTFDRSAWTFGPFGTASWSWLRLPSEKV